MIPSSGKYLPDSGRVTGFVCHHPTASRRMLCEKIEECVECLDRRFVSDDRWRPAHRRQEIRGGRLLLYGRDGRFYGYTDVTGLAPPQAGAL